MIDIYLDLVAVPSNIYLDMDLDPSITIWTTRDPYLLDFDGDYILDSNGENIETTIEGGRT